jgi:hypothetical protein
MVLGSFTRNEFVHKRKAGLRVRQKGKVLFSSEELRGYVRSEKDQRGTHVVVLYAGVKDSTST